MKISYLYLQLRVSSGYQYPSLNFEAPFVKYQQSSEFLSDQQTKEGNNKRRKSKKSSILKTSDITALSSEERRGLFHRIKGRRNNRELIFESFYFPNKEGMQSTSNENSSTTDEQGEKQEICFVCDSNDGDSLQNQDIMNTFLIPHLTPSSVPSPSNPQSFPPEEEEQQPSSRSESAATGRCSSSLDGATSPNMQHPYRSITYYSGNPAVVTTRGIVQLFKSNYKVEVGDGNLLPQTDTLLMMAVPATVNAHGVIEFASIFCDALVRMQIIRDRTPNQYMVLLKFDCPEAAYNCFLTLNNKPYRSDQPDQICHLAFVAKLEVLPAIGQKEAEAQQIPLNTTELPDCMVCLERMDESVRGVLTILCNHSFHAACLLQWEDLCCPVCRYLQTPEPYSHNKCQTCGALEDLWICLICGNVGCGRYTSEHAQQHYSETYHNFAMSLNDDRVWDYVGDYFVHRLNQKDDGKLVEKKDGSSKDDNRDNKIFDIQLECMHLLSTQLDSQRKYWEERLSEVEKKMESGQKDLANKHKEIVKEHQELKIQVDVLGKEKKHLTLKNSKLGTKFREALKDLGVERELNKGLMENQSVWKNKVVALEKEREEQNKEIKDLKEQLRDIMLHIEATKLIDSEGKDTKDEIRDGKVLVGEPSASNRRNRARKNR